MNKVIPSFLAGIFVAGLLLYAALRIWFGPYTLEALTGPTGRAFLQSYSALRIHHYQNPQPQALLTGAVQGMVKQLNDPYSLYLSPEEVKAHLEYKQGQYPAIGVSVRPIKSGQKTGGRIIRVQADTPAAKAGLKAGDMVRFVDGASVEHLPALNIAAKFHGPAGSVVRLGILRSSKPIEVAITRANIPYVPIEHRMLAGNIGHIAIWGFLSEGSTSTLAQFQAAMKELNARGVKALVLDLRDNNGGVVEQATQVADAFMKEGALLITRDKSGQVKLRREAKNQADDFSGPLVVLTNHRTGSAPEILVAALQESGRAKILGEPTVGKAVAGTMIMLANGGAIVPTIVEWLTPRQRPIPSTGIVPDIAMKDDRFSGGRFDPDPLLNKAVALLRQELGQ